MRIPLHKRRVVNFFRRGTGGLAACAVLVATLVVPAVPADARPKNSDEIPSDAFVASGSFLISAFADKTGKYKPKKTPSKAKGAPVSKEEGKKKSRETAFATNTKSFYDTAAVAVGQDAAGSSSRPASLDSRVPGAAVDLGQQPTAQEPAAQGFTLAAISTPTDATECLARPQATSPNGVTHNRRLWCQRGKVVANYSVIEDGKPRHVGTTSMKYEAVVDGRKDAREARIFFRSVPGSVDYDNWDTQYLLSRSSIQFEVRADCAETVTFCTVSPSGYVQQWAAWDNDGSWKQWTLTSHESASTADDKVLNHSWYFSLETRGSGFAPVAEVKTPARRIRCDSAQYFPGQPYSCVNMEVLPHIQYRVSDDRVREVAQHIWIAQNHPNSTYPIEGWPKEIPGKWTGDPADQGLTRADSRQVQDENTIIKNAACDRRYPYSPTTGLPARAAGQQCDEYPFASVNEGAAADMNDFSVRGVDKDMNEKAGSLLSSFYSDDRILRSDEFWVEVLDCGDCGRSTLAPPVPVNSAAKGRLGGSFIQPELVDQWSDATLGAEFASMSSINMKDVVLQWAANNYDKRAGNVRTVVYPTSLPGYTRTTTTDVVERLLTQGDQTGVNVWVGLPVSDAWWYAYAYDPWWLGVEADSAKQMARELWSKYGHHPSFKGWYLSFELDNVHFGTASAQSNMVTFYQSVVGELRRLTPLTPVAIAPFYNAMNTYLPGWQGPAQWGQMWHNILSAADVDVIALQDGVGAGHATPSMLAPWFSAMKNAIASSGSPAHLYSDTETFRLGPSGLEPMVNKEIVAALDAVEPYVEASWAFSFNHYQSPRSPFQVSAFYNAYTSWAQTATGDGTDGSAPSTPGGLTATTTNPQTIALSWAGSADTGSGVAGYKIFRDGELVADLLGNPTSFVDRQLDGSRTFTYQIQAFDGSGNDSGMSNTASAATPALPVSPVNYARCGAGDDAPGCAYTSSAPADPAYPDTDGRSLTNGKHGPELYSAEWQGRLAVGEYSFTIDLGSTRTITEINSSWFQVRQDYAFLPPRVKYLVSNDGTNYVEAASIDIPAAGPRMQAKWYRAINLSTPGRYVKVVVDGGTAWTMIDEVEVRGS